MAYQIYICNDSSSDDLLLDLYLGSALTIEMYWESIGRKLELPIISTLTEKADSEEGLALSGNDLVLFKDEMNIFEKYWISENSNFDLPEGFLVNIRKIVEETEHAISRGLTLMVS